MGLEPVELGLLARNRQYRRMVDEHDLLDCVECGSCAYVCPAGIPLVQYMRIAKSIHREPARSAA
jgi:electron transport complex protein RnfC